MSTLPLSAEELPATIKKFASAKAPTPARMMAAKGLVPIKGNDLVLLLCQLSVDPEPTVRDAAEESLNGLPEVVLLPACEGALPPAVIDELSRRFRDRIDVLERIVQNSSISAETLTSVAARAPEPICEIIAENQQRLLEAPEIIEALYKNKNTRMSTADRLVELAARNHVELRGIPAFKHHVEAIQGQLIIEPTDEPLPSDTAFTQALEADAAEAAIDIDSEDGEESVKERFRPLSFRIRDMNIAEKIRFAVVGDAAARTILVRDPNRVVAFAAISSPRMKEPEAIAIAHSKEVSEDVLRYIGNRREWLRSYEMKRALVFNPKAPLAIAMRLLNHLRPNDLKTLAKSRGIPGALRTTAQQRLVKRGSKR